MGKAVTFEGSEGVEDYPPGQPSRPLPVKYTETGTLSCWELSQDEVDEIVRTRRVWLHTQLITPAMMERSDEERLQAAVFVGAHRAQAQNVS